jgi:predicted dehydrogenase
VSGVRPLAVALAGCGGFARHHIEAWLRRPRARLAALVDPDPAARVAARALVPGAAAFATLDAALRGGGIDLVDVCAGERAHADLVLAAARAGVACVCQKPLTPDLESSVALVDAVDRLGGKLIVHENWRFRPWFRETRRLIESGALGAVRSLTFRFRPGDGAGQGAYGDRPASFREASRFLIHETGIHFIDTFRHLLGEPVAVTARLRNVNPAIAGEDAGLVVFEFAEGAVAVLDADRTLDHAARGPRFTSGTMLVEGSGATLRLDGEGRLFLRRAGAPNEIEHAYAIPSIGYAGDSVGAQIEHILDHMLDGRPVPNDGQSYLANIRIEAAIYRAAEEGRTIRIAAA